MTPRTIILATLAALAMSGPASALECGDDLAAWKAAVAEEAKQAGVGERGLSALADARIDPEVLKRDRAQGVFSQTFAEFS